MGTWARAQTSLLRGSAQGSLGAGACLQGFRPQQALHSENLTSLVWGLPDGERPGCPSCDLPGGPDAVNRGKGTETKATVTQCPSLHPPGSKHSPYGCLSSPNSILGPQNKTPAPSRGSRHLQTLSTIRAFSSLVNTSSTSSPSSAAPEGLHRHACSHQNTLQGLTCGVDVPHGSSNHPLRRLESTRNSLWSLTDPGASTHLDTLELGVWWTAGSSEGMHEGPLGMLTI